MKIVIIGDGKVDFAIAKQLSQEGYDLTIIENKPQVLNLTMDVLDVVGVQGNGGDYDVLKEAQVNQADLVIAVTSSDEINIISCLMAKKMGADHTIARIRNPKYIAKKNVRSLNFLNLIKINSFSKKCLEIYLVLIFIAPLIQVHKKFNCIEEISLLF